MMPQRIFGLVLLAVGVALVVIGMNASHSVADQMTHTFTGRFTDHTTWTVIGGVVAGLVGLSMLFIGTRGDRA